MQNLACHISGRRTRVITYSEVLNWIQNLLASKTTFLAILMFLDWNDFKLFAPLVIILRTLCGLLSGLLSYALFVLAIHRVMQLLVLFPLMYLWFSTL